MKMKRALWLLLAVAACGPCDPVFADDAVPGEPNWSIVRFPAGPAAVTVDILELGGAQVADDVAATLQQLDAADSDAWAIDLSQVPGYPVNCEPNTYMVRWTPDAADCSAAGDPSDCILTDYKVGGAACRADPSMQVSYEYAYGVFAEQGITETVRKFYARKGVNPIRWRRMDVAVDGDFTSPSHTKWEVYFYGENGGLAQLTCTVVTETDPASTLPSSANCAGN